MDVVTTVYVMCVCDQGVHATIGHLIRRSSSLILSMINGELIKVMNIHSRVRVTRRSSVRKIQLESTDFV